MGRSCFTTFPSGPRYPDPGDFNPRITRHLGDVDIFQRADNNRDNQRGAFAFFI